MTESRRQWRWAPVTAVFLALAGCGSDGGQDGADDPAPSSSTPVAGTSATCPDGAEPRQVMYDHGGYKSFTEMLKAEAEIRGAYSVDRSTERLLYLRDDGSVHTELFWMGEARQGGGNRSDWFPSSAADCADEEAWTDVPLDLLEPAQPLTLEVGHCWIEPASLGGEMWDVVEEDQFGWGGQQPPDFAGTGEAWRAGNVVTYVDESGHWLTLVPTGDPWALDRGLCD